MMDTCELAHFAAWKYVKLMEVTVSSDPHEAKVPGHVVLVRDGFVTLRNAFGMTMQHFLMNTRQS